MTTRKAINEIVILTEITFTKALRRIIKTNAMSQSGNSFKLLTSGFHPFKQAIMITIHMEF